MELSGLLLNKFMPKKIVFLFFLTLYVVFLFVIFPVGTCVRSGCLSWESAQGCTRWGCVVWDERVKRNPGPSVSLSWAKRTDWGCMQTGKDVFVGLGFVR